MNILEAIKKKLKTRSNNDQTLTNTKPIGGILFAEAIKNMRAVGLDGEPEDEIVPVYGVTNDNIDWAVLKSNGGENFIVNVKVSGAYGGRNYTIDDCDKTAAEISTAYKAGKNVVARIKHTTPIFEGIDSYIMPLTFHSELRSQSLLWVGFFSMTIVQGGSFGIAAFMISNETPSFKIVRLSQDEEQCE